MFDPILPNPIIPNSMCLPLLKNAGGAMVDESVAGGVKDYAVPLHR
jgi:hypothetical protein